MIWIFWQASDASSFDIVLNVSCGKTFWRKYKDMKPSSAAIIGVTIHPLKAPPT